MTEVRLVHDMDITISKGCHARQCDNAKNSFPGQRHENAEMNLKLDCHAALFTQTMLSCVTDIYWYN